MTIPHWTAAKRSTSLLVSMDEVDPRYSELPNIPGANYFMLATVEQRLENLASDPWMDMPLLRQKLRL